MLIFCAFGIATSIILPGVASFISLRSRAVGDNTDKSHIYRNIFFPYLMVSYSCSSSYSTSFSDNYESSFVKNLLKHYSQCALYAYKLNIIFTSDVVEPHL